MIDKSEIISVLEKIPKYILIKCAEQFIENNNELITLNKKLKELINKLTVIYFDESQEIMLQITDLKQQIEANKFKKGNCIKRSKVPMKIRITISI